MQERKNLAKCKPTEFLKQTNRVRKAVEEFMKETGINEIRMEKIEGIEPIPKDGTPEEIAEIKARNIQRVNEKSKENARRIVDIIMENEKTLSILALACFVEPEDIDNYSIGFYLNNLSDILSDKDVLGFFTSLAQLGQTGILSV